MIRIVRNDRKRRAMLMLASLIIAVSGCGGDGGSTTPPEGTTGMVALSGLVHGGQNPVAGAQVFVYQAGSSGYGAGDRQLACTTTGTGGQFSFGSTSPACAGTGLGAPLLCPASGSPDIYLVAVGGNPGTGTNSALKMMTVLGNCNALPAGLTVTLNEVTTVASMWSLSRFTACSSTPGTSCPSTAANIGTSATNQTGLATAMAAAGNLANLGIGAAQGSAGGITRPASQLNTLADILQDCVNSNGAASSACNNLLTCVVPGATPGTGNAAPCTVPAGTTLPADTLTAALDIARNPANNVATLFSLTSKTPAFTPALSTTPNDWTLSLNYASALIGPVEDIDVDATGNVWVVNPFPAAANTVLEMSPVGDFLSDYTGGGLGGPFGVAVDAVGSIWATSLDSEAITEISSSGVFLSGANGFMGGGIVAPFKVAIDAQGNAWVADGANAVIKITPTGTFLSGSSGFKGGGLSFPEGISIDAAGNVWVTNIDGNSVTELNSSGGFVSPSSGCPGTTNCAYTGGGLNHPNQIAIDRAGNAWVTNTEGNSVTEISPAGKFVSPSSGCPGTTNCAFQGGGLNMPVGIASDATGNVWITNGGGNTLTEISAAGKFLSPANGYAGAGLNDPVAIAIDAGGDLWLANSLGDTISEFVGLATPVLTPKAVCLKMKTGHAVCLP
jgi:streptogramin lyase